MNFNKIERLFDLALMMDCSQCPLHPQLKDIFWDYAKRHPTLAGSYLAAATTFATIFKKSPVGLKYTAGLDAATAAFFQGVAEETVAAYFKR